MPAFLDQNIRMKYKELQRRDWQNAMGPSGMTPTAFAFLIPVFVIVVFAPFLCVFCIRRRRTTPPVTAHHINKKKPALRRAEARERLNSVTEVSNVTDSSKARLDGVAEVEERRASTSSAVSVSERECAICLSTLHAPSPPEPAALPPTSLIDEAATRPASIHSSPSTPEEILKLHACGHEFHAECLVSWVVLRKTTCPICRTVYISKEEMGKYDEEAEMGMVEVTPTADTPAAGPPTAVHGTTNGQRRISNWRYFWAGQTVYGGDEQVSGANGRAQGQRRSRWRIWQRSN